MVYYFTKSKGHQYLTNSINCAIELTELAYDFSKLCGRSYGIDQNVHLNIGLHEGQEFFGTIRSGGGVEFTALGSSLKVARRLSELAADGEIWATKELVSRIPAEKIDHFTFGVFRDQTREKMMYPETFALAGDYMESDSTTVSSLGSIADYAITEIRSRTGHLHG